MFTEYVKKDVKTYVCVLFVKAYCVCVLLWLGCECYDQYMHKTVVNSRVNLFSPLCICSFSYKTESSFFCIYLTFSLYFWFKVTVLRTILGLDVTSSRNHHVVKSHEPAIAHLLCPVWRGGRGWTRKLTRWVLSFLTAQRKDKWDLVSHSQTYSLLHILTYFCSLILN